MQTISWEVIHWKALARKIWFPTANLYLENGVVEDGTYKINILHDWKIFLWAWAYREKEDLFEAHLFDFEWDLYWKNIEVVILEKIRENVKIHSLEELKELIDKDIEYIRWNCFYWITFGTFDKFHPWHISYLSQAKKYCEKLITVLSTDANVEKIKNHTPVHNQAERKVVCLWYDQEWFVWELEKYISKNDLNIEIIRLESHKPEIFKSSKM